MSCSLTRIARFATGELFVLSFHILHRSTSQRDLHLRFFVSLTLPSLRLPVSSSGLPLIPFPCFRRHWRFTKQYILKYTNFPIATGGSPIVKYLQVSALSYSSEAPS